MEKYERIAFGQVMLQGFLVTFTRDLCRISGQFLSKGRGKILIMEFVEADTKCEMSTSFNNTFLRVQAALTKILLE